MTKRFPSSDASPPPTGCPGTDAPADPESLEQVPWEPADDAARARATLDALLATFEPDDRPLHEQDWLWAEAHAVPFRVHPHDLTWHDPAALVQVPSFARWWTALNNGLTAWLEQPLVWRVKDGVAQAVFMGVYRFTWSPQAPQGRCEVQDLGQGWADHAGPLSWPTLCLTALGRMNVAPQLVEQIARHAQRHRRHLAAWDLGTGLSANPTMAPLMDLSGDSLPLARRFRAALRAFTHALTRLDPFWGTVARTLWRRYPVGLKHSVGTIDNDPLPLLLARWNAWKAVAAEHPRAHLLLGDAVRVHHLPPNVHTWRPEVWQALRTTYGLLRASTWNAMRTAPLAQVATACRMDSGAGAFEVLTLCQVPYVLPAVLRKVPESWWIAAKGAFQDLPVREAMATFPVRRVRAFLDAARPQPWVDQRMTLAQWLLVMQPVMEWASEQDCSPCPDPSWSWNSLVRVWMDRLDRDASAGAWPVPFAPCFHQDLRVSVVASDPTWEMLGGVMGNCLKDERSDTLRANARGQRGILVRLSGTETSAVFFEWDDDLMEDDLDPDPGGVLLDDHDLALNPQQLAYADGVMAYARDHGYVLPGDEDDPNDSEEAGHELENLGDGDDGDERADGVLDDAPMAQPVWVPQRGTWTIDQHYAGHNTMPSPLHEAVARDLLVLLNATVGPGTVYPAGTLGERLDVRGRSDLRPLLGMLDPNWGPEVDPPDSASADATVPAEPCPSWWRPWARLKHWANDDRWWTLDAWRQRRRQRRLQHLRWVVLEGLLLLSLALGATVGWSAVWAAWGYLAILLVVLVFAVMTLAS